MCGFCGVVNLENKSQVPPDVLESMLNRIGHRGPDDRGVYTNKEVILGHCRLSILDLSSAGHQPMVSQDGSAVIVYNGEVYNFVSIREELQEEGVKFFSDTDTEVVLQSYLRWHLNCLDKFVGMFAMAIYDEKKKKVFLVRDRLGIKPLYYSFFDGKLIFASELGAILSYPGFIREPNWSGISSYINYRYPIYDLTFYNGIKSLLPGHFLEVDLLKSDVKLKKYWDLPLPGVGVDRGESFYKQETYRLLLNSVRDRLVSDVPVGAYLSGGLDSSLIVAFMAQCIKSELKTYTIGFEDSDFNEFYFARLVANRYDVRHYEILLSYDDYVDNMIDLLDIKASPLSVLNGPALYVMSKELKRDFTVVLSGEGADELFGGYGRIFRSPHVLWSKRFFLGKSSLSAEEEVDFFLSRYQYIPWKDKELLFSREFVEDVLKPAEKITRRVFVNYFSYLGKKVDLYNKLLWIFEKVHLVGLLHRLDTSTMAASVEGRVPFTDHRLVEFVMRMPFHYKLKWRSPWHFLFSLCLEPEHISERYDIPKYLLKKISESLLPREVIYRKKLGFPVPVQRILWRKVSTLLRSFLLSPNARSRGIYNLDLLERICDGTFPIEKDHSLGLKVWMLLNLEIWFQKYMD